MSWETTVEVDNAGFFVYRASDPGGPFSQVNPVVLAPQAPPGQGARYEYLDEPGPGQFYYRLTDVDVHGVRTDHGPVPAFVDSFRADQAGWRVFLPAIAR